MLEPIQLLRDKAGPDVRLGLIPLVCINPSCANRALASFLDAHGNGNLLVDLHVVNSSYLLLPRSLGQRLVELLPADIVPEAAPVFRLVLDMVYVVEPVHEVLTHETINIC